MRKSCLLPLKVANDLSKQKAGEEVRRLNIGIESKEIEKEEVSHIGE